MNDIKPPQKRPIASPSEPEYQSKPEISPSFEPKPIAPTTPGIALRKKRPVKKMIIGGIAALLVLVVAALAGGYLLYQDLLRPLAPSSTEQVKVVVKPGMSPGSIAILLDEAHVIKSPNAFELYVKLSKSAGALQAGTYMLSKSMSVQDIVSHLKLGKTDTFRITFFPGATLRDTTDKPAEKKTDVVSMLKRSGFSDAEIARAFEKTYDHPLLASKPASADLEGYIYGETYEFSSSGSIESIFMRTFDEMYKVVEEQNLEQAFKKKGLSLYEGITLASIIQREVIGAEDQKLVAGIFYNRLAQGEPLGSDVTYQYAADKTGQERSPDLDSPYNTRRYKNLPPGPIAVPGASALIAAANPTKTDYIFFLSGDDDKTYFAETQAGHEENIKNHCAQKCLIL